MKSGVLGIDSLLNSGLVGSEGVFMETIYKESNGQIKSDIVQFDIEKPTTPSLVSLHY